MVFQHDNTWRLDTQRHPLHSTLNMTEIFNSHGSFGIYLLFVQNVVEDCGGWHAGFGPFLQEILKLLSFLLVEWLSVVPHSCRRQRRICIVSLDFVGFPHASNNIKCWLTPSSVCPSRCQIGCQEQAQLVLKTWTRWAVPVFRLCPRNAWRITLATATTDSITATPSDLPTKCLQNYSIGYFPSAGPTTWTQRPFPSSYLSSINT